VKPLGKAGSHGGPQHDARSIDMMDVTVQSTGTQKPHPDSIWPRSFCYDNIHTSQQRGWRQLCQLTSSLRKSGRTHRPSSWRRNAQVKAWSRHVAPTDGGQKINALHVFMLQGNYFHRIRRRTATPEATFSVFLFHSTRFLPLYHDCNLPPPLRSYKRGGRGHI
jgi:hypothetical protein